MGEDKMREIEDKIADLKARWPAHSVPPSMWQQLEELEEDLGKPVLSANQVTMWDALRIAGVKGWVPGAGSLYDLLGEER